MLRYLRKTMGGRLDAPGPARVKCPMEQVAAPDKKKTMGPLNQAPTRLLWTPWAAGATQDPKG